MRHTFLQMEKLLQKNLLGVKRDSLKARYDAMCSVVRMIRIRMKEEICKE